MSTGMKVLLGVAGTAVAAYGCIVGHRALNKPSIEKVAKNFSEIFRRDVSKEEAQQLFNAYKELFQIKDKDEFVNRIYKQIKKDYGYENADIPLVIKKLENKHNIAHWNQFDGNIAINTDFLNEFPQKLKCQDKERIMNSIVHEFQHTKQAEFAFRTNANAYLDQICSDKTAPETLLWLFENYRESMAKSLLEKNSSVFKTKNDVDKFITNAIKKLKEDSYKSDKEIMETIASVKEDCRAPVNRIFGNLEKFNSSSENYQLGLKYLENQKNYINAHVNEKAYREQLIEKEAFGTEDKLSKLYKRIASIWRL